MKQYHLRRAEKALTEEALLFEIIRGQKFMTLAFCSENEPYLATVNYGFDAEARCFYFHCAPQGRKMDYLRANPVVWGQVMEDHGYLPGKCDHAFRTVQFRGRATIIEDPVAKRAALMLMIEQLEPDPEPMKKHFDNAASLARATLVRIEVEVFTGKQSKVQVNPDPNSP